MTPRLSLRAAAVTMSAALALVACGGGDAESEPAGEQLPAVVVADAVTIDPASDIATNLLPDLIVDNLQDDNKVNLRNYGTGDRPILLWMWAPH